LIDVSLPPDIAAAGTDFIICDNQAQLAANSPLVGNGSWTLISGQGTISDSSDPASSLIGLVPGTVILEWTIQSGTCPPQSDQIQISVNPPLAPADAGPDQNICGNAATLAALLSAPLSGNWTILNGQGTLSSASDPSAQVIFLTSGTTTLQWQVTDGVCPPVSDIIVIAHTNPPSPPQAGSDFSTCQPAATLQANGLDPGSWTIISGSASVDFPFLPNATLTGTASGAVTCQWTVGQAPCPVQSDLVVVTFGGLDLSVEAGANQIIQQGQTTLISATASEGEIQWIPATGLSCSDCINPVATPDSSTWYVVTITDSAGCAVSDSVKIDVKPATEIYIPTGFSPNRDGYNDVFFVRGLGIEWMRFLVFDRLGEVVASLSKLEDGWDGTFRGQTSSAGVYFYSGEIGMVDGTIRVVQGEVTLSR
jgi:gliding motility-associated-like protein